MIKITGVCLSHVVNLTKINIYLANWIFQIKWWLQLHLLDKRNIIIHQAEINIKFKYYHKLMHIRTQLIRIRIKCL